MPKDNPLINKHAPLKEWLPLALDENNWMDCIDEYFNSCRNIVNLDDLNPENMNEPEIENEVENEVEKELEPEKNDSPEETHAEVPLSPPPLSSPHTAAEP